MCVIYAFLGLFIFCRFAFTDDEYLTLPFGIVAPLFYLNFNLRLPRSTNVAYSLFMGIAAIVAYAITGWITGAAAALSFNFVAKKMGGVEAKYFTTVEEKESTQPDV